MATAINQTKLDLRRALDAVCAHSNAGIEVSQIGDQNAELLVRRLLSHAPLASLDQIPGLKPKRIFSNPSEGVGGCYKIVDPRLEKYLKHYAVPQDRLEVAESIFFDLRLCVRNIEPRGLSIEGFENGQEAAQAGRDLQEVGWLVNALGDRLVTTDGEIIDIACKILPPAAPDKSQEGPTDAVDHPDHYQSGNGLEAIEVIEAFFHENAFLANVFKYLARAGKKGGEAKLLEDLKKARWYLEREIAFRETATKDT
jgi:hypothetical protein